MPKLLLIAFILSLTIVGCSSNPTPTPTSPPPPVPTDTPIVPTDTPTSIPPTATLAPTAVPPTPTPTPLPITGTVQSNSNVRQTPNLTGKLLGQVKKGDTLTLVGRSPDSTWLEINYPLDQTSNGWVLARLVKTTAALDSLPSMTAEGTPAPTLVALGTPTLAATKAVTVAETITTTKPVTGTTAKATPTTQPGTGGAPAGSIIFDTFEGGQYQISRVRADGSGLTTLFTGASEPALSVGNRLAYHKRNGAAGAGLAVANLDGSNEQIITAQASAGYPSWSPDGQNLVFHLLGGGSTPDQVFWMAPQRGSDQTKVGLGQRPAWQPGSNLVIFDGCDANGGNCGSLHTENNVYQPDPANPVFVIHGTNAAWSPNGSQLAFHDVDASGSINIFIANRDGSGKRQVTKDSGHNGDPIWSSDGQWIFYRSDKGGSWALYAVRTDGSSDRKIADAPVNPSTWDYEKLAIAP